jgi:hypothetical protein|tara:strand:- start:8666 stop:9040 length:375 start_codon:yes stop_codon:yes gene_type:complete
MKIRAYKDNILCTNADFGDQTTEAGIILKSTLGKEEGILPRWFKVFDVGPEIDWVKAGQWLYVEYGRWTEGIKIPDDRLEPGTEIWKVDPKGCLAVSDDAPVGTVSVRANDGLEFARKLKEGQY